MTSITFRRKKNSDVWHWCKNCSNWPKRDYVEKRTQLFEGKLCVQCKSKDALRRCQT